MAEENISTEAPMRHNRMPVAIVEVPTGVVKQALYSENLSNSTNEIKFVAVSTLFGVTSH